MTNAVGQSATGARARGMTSLFAPRSVAVVGASDDSAKWGYLLSRHVLESGTSAAIHLVNRRGAPVLGRPTVRTLAEARVSNGGPIDLVALCVPASGYLEAIDEALAAGSAAIVAITAGLGERDGAGRALEAEALDRVRAHGAVLVGPNCLGVVDTTTNLQLSSELLPAGDITVLSQSGNLVIDLADHLRSRGLGIARFVSLGNQTDLGVVDFMRACLDHDGTRAVAVYAEDVRDGRGFVEAARALQRAEKPVVLLAPGRSAAAVRGAASHTGSLTSRSQVVDAACAAGGVRRVETPDQIADLLLALRQPRRAGSRRVAVLTDGGGHGAVAADAVEALGLQVPVLSAALQARLMDALWASSTPTNPVDLAGAGEVDPRSYARAVTALLESDEVDSVLLTGYFGGYSLVTSTLTDRELTTAQVIADVVLAQAKPLVVHTINPDGPSCRLLHGAGIPVFREVGRAARVVDGLSVPDGPALSDDLRLPTPAAPLTDTGYVGARDLFARAGVPFPASIEVADETALRAAITTRAVRLPVVLKATGLLHKSDVGGVVLGLLDEEEAVRAYRDIVERLAPPSVCVEEMADLAEGVELVVGTVTDPKFGPVVMVGLGGVFTEVLADTSLAIAPVGVETAHDMLLSLRGAPLLLGTRGRARVDVDALGRLVADVSRLSAAHPELAELELNPVLATPTGVLALDARAVPRLDGSPS